MATSVCPRCGRPFTPNHSLQQDHEFDTLAETPGVTQPPEAAGALAGATPFGARLGTDSGPVEYASERDPAGELCPACRAAVRGGSA